MIVIYKVPVTSLTSILSSETVLQVCVRVFDPFMQVFQVKSLTDGVFIFRKLVRSWKSAASDAAIDLLTGDAAQPHGEFDWD